MAKKDSEAGAENTTAKADIVSVQWNGGVREFSKEVHGDDFESLAKQFADKHKGTIV